MSDLLNIDELRDSDTPINLKCVKKIKRFLEMHWILLDFSSQIVSGPSHRIISRALRL